ncbi:hypothetical protein CDHC01_0083 [Corynebacterium diphtheriae HC01]|uniref:hypothetical protein n=1 Tax=Corynebacterium TaxID=1716 RepID=UPI000245BC22|nr:MULTISPECIES: hypothetical protein [Corynebacterium]AEX43149.1 hypothetical protein CD241_0082 [Corynebacterium diphtheriae 241]AEX73336.1 hypothetical protein CDHC01_0083 [Corynebacterium diphtheriae HC01]MBG9331605.1 hypothetical protein [Corynebacterium belfantii]OLN14917.1 hypothetical protein BUE64_10380 [Corynebacterium diphtheriae subsp. lausannense]
MARDFFTRQSLIRSDFWQGSLKVHTGMRTFLSLKPTWAYREIRHHFGDPDGLGRAIQTAAQAMNQELFSDPLPA